MPVQTDAMIARFEQELEERSAFIEGLIANAQEANEGRGRDLVPQEMELVNNAKARITTLNNQLDPLRETAKIAVESRANARRINDEIMTARGVGNRGPVEYRTAGAYIADQYLAQLGDDGANMRLEVFNRAAAHQTTADNPGLLPEQIVGPVINLVDMARPVVSAIGPTDLPAGSWAYAKVTTHTQVGVQAGEKTELASRKMTVTKTPITAPLFGGYVNVSKQDISRTSPQILDMIIADLGGQYAIETENAADDALVAGATASAGTALPTTPTAAQVAGALWTAAAEAYTGMQGLGRLFAAVSPDMLGLVGPLFAPVNPQNSQSTGFEAGSFGQGAMGAISGISVVMSVGFAAKTLLVVNTAAVKCFENRYEALQVVEPSVWGVQVGYAGEFQTVIQEPKGVIKVGVT